MLYILFDHKSDFTQLINTLSKLEGSFGSALLKDVGREILQVSVLLLRHLKSDM